LRRWRSERACCRVYSSRSNVACRSRRHDLAEATARNERSNDLSNQHAFGPAGGGKYRVCHRPGKVMPI